MVLGITRKPCWKVLQWRLKEGQQKFLPKPIFGKLSKCSTVCLDSFVDCASDLQQSTEYPHIAYSFCNYEFCRLPFNSFIEHRTAAPTSRLIQDQLHCIHKLTSRVVSKLVRSAFQVSKSQKFKMSSATQRKPDSAAFCREASPRPSRSHPDDDDHRRLSPAAQVTNNTDSNNNDKNHITSRNHSMSVENSVASQQGQSQTKATATDVGINACACAQDDDYTYDKSSNTMLFCQSCQNDCAADTADSGKNVGRVGHVDHVDHDYECSYSSLSAHYCSNSNESAASEPPVARPLSGSAFGGNNTKTAEMLMSASLYDEASYDSDDDDCDSWYHTPFQVASSVKRRQLHAGQKSVHFIDPNSPSEELVLESGTILIKSNTCFWRRRSFVEHHWIRYGRNCLYFFLSKADAKRWIHDKTLTKVAREKLVQLCLDFERDSVSDNIMGYKSTCTYFKKYEGFGEL